MAEPKVNARKEQLRKWLLSTAVAAASVVLLIAVILMGRPSPPTLQDMNIVMPEESFAALAQGEAWQPRSAEKEFIPAAENGRFRLLLEPKTGQIAVEDLQSGWVWRSNPTEEELAAETVRGTQLANLQSPYILEYVKEGTSQRLLINALDEDITIRYAKLEEGLQAEYTHSALGLAFAMQYRLTEHGLEVMVPDAGIREEGEFRLLSLTVLPYFGAVQGKAEEGYLFVPDGPGGLIYFHSNRPLEGNRYDYAVYDPDATLLAGETVPREPISYPVFGLKRGQQAYVAILHEGKYSAWIQAFPAGVQNAFHSVSARFPYRQEYYRKTSRMGTPTLTIQRQRQRSDFRIEYRFLTGEDAGYTGMARSYREALIASGSLPERMDPAERIPLQLTLIGGGTKDVFGGRDFAAATTFEEAEEIVNGLADLGVQEIQVVYQGWQSGGFIESDRSLPIHEKLGGAAGARRFIEAMHGRGFPVLFATNIVWRDPERSTQTARSDAVRSIDSTVTLWKEKRRERFLLNPRTAVISEKRTIDYLRELGADGMLYTHLHLLYRDFHPDRPLSRSQAAALYQGLLEYTRNQLGMAAVERGNDYLLSSADWIIPLPLDSSYDFLIDETVPFYPMVIHGSIPYTAAPGNLRNTEEEWLKAIEYGALPSFVLTYARSRELKGTDYDHIFSSEYRLWAERIAEEYEAFNQLAPLLHRQIVNHEKRSEGVFVTTYDDGTQVIVDYHAKTFEVRKGGAER